MKSLFFIDVHCHIDMCKNIEKRIENAREMGVKVIVTNGVNPENNMEILDISSKYREVRCALGIYPIDALKLSDDEIDKEIRFIKLNKDKIAAVGEVGLDFKEDLENKESQSQQAVGYSLSLKLGNNCHSKLWGITPSLSNKDRQKAIFEKFVKLAEEINKPIIVHSRKAEKECIEILEKSRAKKVLMHCFSGKLSLAERIAKTDGIYPYLQM